MDAKQGGKKAASTGSAAATASGSNINLADETTDKNLHLTEAQREELEDAENKEAAAKKKHTSAAALAFLKSAKQIKYSLILILKINSGKLKRR